MKRETFYAKTNRSGNLLHIETDGCIVNIHVGLSDDKGRQVTRIDVIPDDERRGGDGKGRVWNIASDGGYDGRTAGAIRVVREPEPEPPPITLVPGGDPTAGPEWEWPEGGQS